MPPHALRPALDGHPDETGAVFASDETPLVMLRKRADFLRAAKANRASASSVLLQARRRGPDEPPAPEATRIGYTCSKKIGNAVARNRAKRRLRAAARAVMPGLAQPGWDYVLVGRPGHTISRDFKMMQDDLRNALRRVHAPRARK